MDVKQCIGKEIEKERCGYFPCPSRLNSLIVRVMPESFFFMSEEVTNLIKALLDVVQEQHSYFSLDRMGRA